MKARGTPPDSPLMRRPSAYAARALRKPLPALVAEKTRHHLLDAHRGDGGAPLRRLDGRLADPDGPGFVARIDACTPDLMASVICERRFRRFCDAVWNIERIREARAL